MKKIFYLLSFLFILLFFYFIIMQYISEKNIKKIEKNRINKNENFSKLISNLPLIENDTNDIIKFNNEHNNIDPTKLKRNFWDLFKNQ